MRSSRRITRPIPGHRKPRRSCIYRLRKKLSWTTPRDDLTRLEHQYFFTNFDRFSGIVSYVQHRNTEFVMQGTKLLENCELQLCVECSQRLIKKEEARRYVRT